MEKLLAMLVASEMTKVALDGLKVSYGADGKTIMLSFDGTVSDYTITVNPDKTIKVLASDRAQVKNDLIWEMFRTWYQPLVQADGDAADWPDPPVAKGQASVGGALGSVGAALTPMLTALGGPTGLATAAQAIEGLLKTSSTAPVAAAPSAPLAPPAASK